MYNTYSMLRYCHDGGAAYVYVINFRMHSLNLLLQFVLFKSRIPTLNLFLLNLIFTFTSLQSTSVTTFLNHSRSSSNSFMSSSCAQTCIRDEDPQNDPTPNGNVDIALTNMAGRNLISLLLKKIL